jgi:hypothetical protein
MSLDSIGSAYRPAKNHQVIVLVTQLLRDADRMDALKPIHKKHDVASALLKPNGDLSLVSQRFKTRIQRHQDQQVRIHTSISPNRHGIRL